MDQSAIQKRLAIIEQLKQERQAAKDMIDDALVNDDEYRHQEAQIQELRDKLKTKKAEILARAENEPIVRKFKEIGQNLKEEREVLAEELVEFYRLTQSNEIKAVDGTRMKLKFSAKLIPLNEKL